MGNAKEMKGSRRRDVNPDQPLVARAEIVFERLAQAMLDDREVADNVCPCVPERALPPTGF